MPFGIDLNPFDDDNKPTFKEAVALKKKEDERKRKKRPKVPESKKKKEYGPADVAKDLLVPGRMFGKVFGKAAEVAHAPEIVKSVPRNVAELGAGLLPAAKTTGKATYHDIRHLARHHDAPTREDMSKYYDLMKWTVADEKGDKRKQPKTDSEIVDLLSAMVRGMGRGVERATPDLTNAKDRKEAKHEWSHDPVFAALNVIPVAAAATRPLSIAKYAREASLLNDVSRGRALALGTKESYVPGALRRAGLKGGIPERVLRSDVGTVGGRPWSRQPLMRELQRTYDEAFNLSPGMARKRVGRARERLDLEGKRRIQLAQTELERPIRELMYGRLATLAGSFGLKEGMSAAERRAATGLAYTLQMPKHMEPVEALGAVQDDLSQILKSGKMEIPRGKRGRVKSVPLTEEQKHNLAIQISDLDLVRQDIHSGHITPDEWDAAIEAMSSITGKTHEMGVDILKRRFNLDDEGVSELEAMFKNRAEVLPRRLAARGGMNVADLADHPVRAARLKELTDQLGPDEAQAGIAISDARARAARPQDPGSYYADAIQGPTGESAEQYLARVGDEGLFQSGLAPGEVGRTLLGSGEFYSPLQKWIQEQMPARMPAAQLEGTLRNAIPPAEFENAGLHMYFDQFDPTEMVEKADFAAHMTNPLNAYNLEEILLSNADDVPEDLGTIFDRAHNGNYMSREPQPGEYFELLLVMPGEAKFFDKNNHWGRPNVAAHVRFHIYEEDGVRKLLVEEIQSDWGNEYRSRLKAEKKLEALSPDERDELDHIRETLAIETERRTKIQTRQREIAHELEQTDDRDLHMEYLNNQDTLDNLTEYIREYERGLREYGTDNTPVAPLGTGTGAKSSYLNPTVRWLLRRADEANVDEIHIVGRETQLARNADLDPRVFHDLKGDGAEAITQYFKDNPYERDRSFIGYNIDIPATFAREMGEEGLRNDAAYTGHYRIPVVGDEAADGRMPSTVFRMTEEARLRARKPKSMYQTQPDWKGLPHGAAELMDGDKSRIHMFATGNISTWIHELGHVGFHDLSEADRRIIETHLGGGFRYDDWTKMEHERFARAFEQYVRKGIAPTKDLASVFSKLSEWMKAIWKEAKDKKVEIDPAVADVFDRMFAKPPSGEMEVHGYFPHRDIHAAARSDYRGGQRPPAAGQVIGVQRLAGDTIQRKPNELMLYQGGAMNPDPAGLIQVYLNRVRFQVTLDARDHLLEVSHPMSEKPPPDAWLVRDQDAPPERISAKTQAAVRGQSLEHPLDDLESKLSVDPEEFRKEIIAKAGEHPEWADDMEHVRWVPGDYVKARFGDVFEEKPRGKMWSTMSLLTSMQRGTGIYGRPLSYIAGNIPFNVLALMSQMPVSSLRNMGHLLEIKRRDPTLYRAIISEGGETRAGGGLPERYVRPQNKTQRVEQKVTRIQRGMAEQLSGIADNPYRGVAFLNNARKRGYTTNAELRHLIESDGTDLHEVRQLTREQMLDFDALNPTQRRIASQFMYLWPFMYASAKWPAMFAREYPGRAALAANQIRSEKERVLPSEITGLWKRYGIDMNTINPVGPLGQIAESAPALLEDPSKLDLTILQERLSPSLAALVEGMGGGRKHALQNFIRGTVPGAAELYSSDPEYRGAKIYKDRSRDSYLKQRHLRFWPRGINKERLGEMIQQALKDNLTTSTQEQERGADWAKIQKYTKAVGGYTDQDVQEISRSYAAWWEYQEAVDEKKDSLGQRKLTPKQQAEVLTPIIEERFPELAGELWDLTDMDEAYQKRHAKAIEEYADALKTAINEGRTMVFDDYSSYGPEK